MMPWIRFLLGSFLCIVRWFWPLLRCSGSSSLSLSFYLLFSHSLFLFLRFFAVLFQRMSHGLYCLRRACMLWILIRVWLGLPCVFVLFRGVLVSCVRDYSWMQWWEAQLPWWCRSCCFFLSLSLQVSVATRAGVIGFLFPSAFAVLCFWSLSVYLFLFLAFSFAGLVALAVLIAFNSFWSLNIFVRFFNLQCVAEESLVVSDITGGCTRLWRFQRGRGGGTAPAAARLSWKWKAGERED